MKHHAIFVLAAILCLTAVLPQVWTLSNKVEEKTNVTSASNQTTAVPMVTTGDAREHRSEKRKKPLIDDFTGKSNETEIAEGGHNFNKINKSSKIGPRGNHSKGKMEKGANFTTITPNRRPKREGIEPNSVTSPVPTNASHLPHSQPNLKHTLNRPDKHRGFNSTHPPLRGPPEGLKRRPHSTTSAPL